MKKVLSTVVALGCCLYLPTAVLAGGGKKVSDDMSREMSDLRAQLAKQQAEIDMLKGQKSDPTLATRLDALEKKKGYVMAGNAFIDGVTLTGSLRERFQMNSLDGYTREDQDQERFRTIARLGGVWQNKAENWTIGAGLATGLSTSNRGAEDTWGETRVFDHADLNLDYMYVKHTMGDYAFLLGQTPYPYQASWIFMDGDLRPTGATVAYGKETGVFAMAGAYNSEVLNVDTGTTVGSTDDNAGMAYIGQVGYKDKFSEKGKYTLALGYHQIDQAQMNEVQRDFFASSDPLLALNGELDDYSVEVGDIYGDVSFPVGPVSLKLYGQVWMNFAADAGNGISQGSVIGKKVVTPTANGNTTTYGTTYILNEEPDDNDMGWSLGFSGTMDQVHFAYSYSVVEADSMWGAFTDAAAAVNTNTNVQGHKANIGYDITKNWALDFTYYNFENVEDLVVASPDNATNNLWEDQVTYQFDVSYKF
jgi:hypothetical protein